jgi:hypothetical protein
MGRRVCSILEHRESVFETRTHSLIHKTAHTDVYKTYHTAYTFLPEDESTTFETCRNQQKLNISSENFAFRLFVLYNRKTLILKESFVSAQVLLSSYTGLRTKIENAAL